MHIRAIFDPKKDVFRLSFEDEKGFYGIELPPAQFARVLEYLELILAGYNERRDNYKRLRDEEQEP